MTIQVISPIGIEDVQHKYLVTSIIDIFNNSVISIGYEIINDVMVVEIPKPKCKLTSVLDEAVKIINENGWVARHDHFYSIKGCYPSYGIIFKQKASK